MTAPLALGAEAFAFVHGPATPGGRRELLGAARVVVESVDPDEHDPACDLYTVRVVAASGGGILVGRRETFSRSALWAKSSRDEREAFGREAARFWPSRGSR